MIVVVIVEEVGARRRALVRRLERGGATVFTCDETDPTPKGDTGWTGRPPELVLRHDAHPAVPGAVVVDYSGAWALTGNAICGVTADDVAGWSDDEVSELLNWARAGGTGPRPALLVAPLQPATGLAESEYPILGNAAVFDYLDEFESLWDFRSLSGRRFQGHVVVLWRGTPPDPDVHPVATERYLTPYDWAIVACTLANPTRDEPAGAQERLRVTVVERFGVNHRYPARDWLFAHRPECVPWLRGIPDTQPISTLPPTGQPNSPDVRMAPRDALRALPICQTDLSGSADHHAIANLVGPLLLLRGPPPSRHAKAILAQLRAVDLAHPGLGSNAPTPSERTFAAALQAHHLHDRLMRLVLLDDQEHHGWTQWLCEQVGVAFPPGWRATSGAPTRVAVHASGRLEVWCSSDPGWLLMGSLDAPAGSPLRRRLQLTERSHQSEAVSEILLLDLRLGARAQLRVRATLAERVLGTGSVTPDSVDDLALLPRAISEADPLLPVVLFSSTGRLDVVQAIVGHDGKRGPSTITSFSKPRPLGEGFAARDAAERALHVALAEAAFLARRRVVVDELLLASGRVRGLAPSGHAALFMDESFPDVCQGGDCYVAGLLVTSRDGSALQSVVDAARRWGQDFEDAFDSDGNALAKSKQGSRTRWAVADYVKTQFRRDLGYFAEQLGTHKGVELRAVVIKGSMGGLGGAGRQFGPTPGWAASYMDREYRNLLRQCVIAAIAYQVTEAGSGVEVTAVTDVRSVPRTGTDQKRFGIPLSEDGRLAFLGQPDSLWPVVDRVLGEDALCRSAVVVEARACKGEEDHRLLHFADTLANEVMRADRARTPLPVWASRWLENGVFVCYDHGTERLLGLARSINQRPDSAPVAVRSLMEEPDAHQATRPFDGTKVFPDVADMCRARVLVAYEAWWSSANGPGSPPGAATKL